MADNKRDYYEVLGVDKSASDDVIKNCLLYTSYTAKHERFAGQRNVLSFRLSSLNHYPLQRIFHEGVTAEHQDEQPEDL